MNYCHRFCGDRALAEDLAQEVFLRMYRAAPKYRPKARFATWLFTIATNVCLNETRKRRKLSGTISFDVPIETREGTIVPEYPDSRQGPDEVIMGEAGREAIQAAMAALPDRQRAALLLKIQHEFSYKEIARQLRCTENTVKTLIRRARQRIAETLGHE